VVPQRAVARQVDFGFAGVGRHQRAIELRLLLLLLLDPLLLGLALGLRFALGLGLGAPDHLPCLFISAPPLLLIGRGRRIAVLHAAVAVHPAIHLRVRHPSRPAAKLPAAR
jgi:hypothetical protein